MGLKYLLDTNICIEVIRRRSPETIARIQRHDVGEIGVSTITVSELDFGAAKSRDPQRNSALLAQFLIPLEVMPYDRDAAKHYGEIRNHLESKGMAIGPLDTLIAAHARSLGVTLVTNDVSEFKRAPQLKIVSW